MYSNQDKEVLLRDRRQLYEIEFWSMKKCALDRFEGSSAVSSVADPDPGSGSFWMPGSGIRDG